jgi:MFS family permease
MAQATAAAHPVENDKKLFWSCWIALVATSFGFIARVLTADAWGAELGLTATQVGEVLGAGLWPFAISIILFSLIIDRVGYKTAMWFGFACHVAAGIMILFADSFSMLYAATVILALGNGTVEAYINPVVATIFTKDKTKWLNILHAGWPGGLVLGGIIIVLLGLEWRIANALILLPAALYGILLAPQTFPVSERVASGVSYRDMLREVGAVGAFLISAMIIFQLGQIIGLSPMVNWILTAVATVAFGLYTKSAGRAMFVLFLIIMIPLATTELGVDSWITSFMAGEMGRMGLNPGWVLIYTSAIMLVLRFFAGGIAHRISPLGLLAACAALATVGLYTLSVAHGAAILLAATLYGVGKTFFWPTTLAVVADQSPRGGALTINGIAGMGMIAVGIVGAPFMGAMQDRATDQILLQQSPELHQQVMEPRSSIFGTFLGMNQGTVAALPPQQQEELAAVSEQSQKEALRTIALLPFIMLLFYLGLAAYFRSKGGYRPAEIGVEPTRPASTDRKTARV